MAQHKPEDHSRSNAIAWFKNIVEMVDALRAANADDNEAHWQIQEDARNAIIESVLSVEVRSDWHDPASRASQQQRDDFGDTSAERMPAEYRILLSTGGPALQLVGELDEHAEPQNAELQHQDWGTPWTRLHTGQLAAVLDPNWERKLGVGDAFERAESYLLDFARVFYFGG